MNVHALLSESDPDESTGGNIALLQLVPGVREWQSYPHYLTAIAVGLEFSKDIPDATGGMDGAGEP